MPQHPESGPQEQDYPAERYRAQDGPVPPPPGPPSPGAWPPPPGCWPPPAQPSGSWPPPPPPPGDRDSTPRPLIQPLTAGVIAVLVALAAAIVVLFATGGHSAAPAAGPGHAPVQGGGGGGGIYGGGGGGGGGGTRLFMAGQVTKVSGTSITLGGQGHTITAAITAATRFSGSVTGASGIKPGDRVAVTISGYGTAHPVAQSISDPPSMP